MARLRLRHVAVMALAAAPGLALAQQDSRPAIMPFGAIGMDGQSAIGAGLRLFPGATAPAIVGAPPAAPAPAAPSPAALPGPVVKPGLGPAPVATAAKPPPLPAAVRSPTAFTTSPTVSAQVRQQVLAATLPNSPNPQGLRQAVDSGAPWRDFDSLLIRHGYDPRDLSDVVAAFYLIAWEVATGGDATLQPAGIAAVRGQARQMLAGLPTLARMSDAERQSTAETLAFHAMAMAARHHDLRQAGGRGLAAYRTEVAEAVAQQQGIDVRRFALTAAGFQAR
jgi:hypothetical protein